MPKFDFPVGKLNNVQLPVISRSIDLNKTSIYGVANTVAEEVLSQDRIAESGPYKGVVLRVNPLNNKTPAPGGFLDFVSAMFGNETASGLKQMVHAKIRIPLLHADLPTPTGEGDPQSDTYPDHHIIDLYQTFTSESDSPEFAKIKPGDIVVVDFLDKKNMSQGVILTPIAVQQHMPSPSSPSGLATHSTLPCSLPTGHMPGGASMGGVALGGVHTGLSEDQLRSRQSGAKAIMLGDSQMVGLIGKGLQDYIEKSLGYIVVKSNSWTSNRQGSRMGRSGSPVSAWVKNGATQSPAKEGKFDFIRGALKQHKPDLVVICLGGNGVGKGNPTKLVNKIRQVASDVKILWIGPPPAVRITKTKTLETGSPWSKSAKGRPLFHIEKRGASRKSLANLIQSEIGAMSNVSYIDPHKHMPKYMTDPGPDCDGIHCTSKGAVELINALKKKQSPAAGGESLEEVNAQKKSHNLSTAAAGVTVTPTGDSVGGISLGAPGAPASALPAIMKDALEKFYESQAQAFTSLGAAKDFLKDRSKLAESITLPYSGYGQYLERDWVSGFLGEDGHIKAMTADVSSFAPARLDEIMKWGNFTSRQNSYISRDPYGVEIVLGDKLIGTGEGASTEDTNPMRGDTNYPPPTATRLLIKQFSYEMAAAVYMVNSGGKKQPTPDAVASPTAVAAATPPCPLANLYGDTSSGAIVLPPDGLQSFIPLVEDAVNKAVALVGDRAGISAAELKLYLRAACKTESGGYVNTINAPGYSGLWAWGMSSWRGASQRSTGRLYQQVTGKSMPPAIRDYNYALSPYVQALVTACSVAGKVSKCRSLGAPPDLTTSLYDT